MRKQRITQDEILELQKQLLELNKKVDNFLVKISNADLAINWQDWFVKKFETIDTEVKQKLLEIREAYKDIIEGDDEIFSIKEELDDLILKLNEKQKKMEALDNKIFWKEITKEDGTKEIIIGTSKQLDELVDKHNWLYQRIEKELGAGSTSVALATVFSNKVESYNAAEDKYSKSFIVFMVSLVAYGILTVMINQYTHNLDSWDAIFKHLLLNLPFLAFAVWLAIFIGNRRAESKKLEESYTHKEVMARAFVWYRDSIQELDSEDNGLLEKHMENLLNTMNKDSSDFLDSKWEKHPFVELFSKITDKIWFPEKIDTSLWTIEFIKK